MCRDRFVSHSHLDRNPKHHNIKSTRMEESCRSCENAEVRRQKLSSPSLWPRSRPLKLSFVAFVGWFSVCACSRAVKCCTEEPFSRSDILWPFPRTFALWLCWDFIEFINVFLGEAFCICAKLSCRWFRVYMSIKALSLPTEVTQRMSGDGRSWSNLHLIKAGNTFQM